MRIFGKNYANNAIGMGALIALLAMVLPVISEPVTSVVTSLRNTVSGLFKKK